MGRKQPNPCRVPDTQSATNYQSMLLLLLLLLFQKAGQWAGRQGAQAMGDGKALFGADWLFYSIAPQRGYRLPSRKCFGLPSRCKWQLGDSTWNYICIMRTLFLFSFIQLANKKQHLKSCIYFCIIFRLYSSSSLLSSSSFQGLSQKDQDILMLDAIALLLPGRRWRQLVTMGVRSKTQVASESNPQLLPYGSLRRLPKQWLRISTASSFPLSQPSKV